MFILLGIYCACCFNQVTSACFALWEADARALPSLALVQVRLCLLPFGQSCLRSPTSKLGIPLPALLCSSSQENARRLLLNGCKALGGGSEVLFPGGTGDGGPWHRREPSHLATGQKPLVKAKSPWKTPRYLQAACSESGKGPSLWCVSLCIAETINGLILVS